MTISQPALTSDLTVGLAPGGRMVILGAGKEPLPVSTGPLVRDEMGVIGSITGAPFESETALAFSVLTHVRPQKETMPLADAQRACGRPRSGGAKFCIVLVTGGEAIRR